MELFGRGENFDVSSVRVISVATIKLMQIGGSVKSSKDTIPLLANDLELSFGEVYCEVILWIFPGLKNKSHTRTR